MKPKEIRKWFLIFTIALSLVSSEYCSGDKTDTVKYERQRESQNSTEKSFRDSDSPSLTSKPLTHRYQLKNTIEKVSHRSGSPNAVRNGIRQNLQVIRRREMPNILNDISFSRSTEIRRYVARDQRSYKKSNSDIDMPSVRNTRTSQVSSKADTLTPQVQAITRKIIQKRSDELHLRENNMMQKENGRYNSQSNRRSHKPPGERTSIFKANRIRIVNNENRQEQQHNIRGENTGTVSRDRLTIRNRSNNKIKKIFANIEKGSTKNKSFISNPANEITRILNTRSRVHDRNFNRLENSLFHRTETINAIQAKHNIRRTEIRSTEARRQDIIPISVTSRSLRRSRIIEVPDKNNILRRAIRAVSLETRDDPQSTFHRNAVRTTREELMNGRYMNRNDRIVRENLRSYASRVIRFQPVAKIDRFTEQNVRRISTWLPSETTQDRKSGYATYSRSDRFKVISTENGKSERSLQNRKENRLTTRGTDEMEYRLKGNIGRLSKERVLVQATRNRDNVNYHRFDINKRVELKNIGGETGTRLDYGVHSPIEKRTNKRYLNRTSDRIIAERRKGTEINIAESATRRNIEKTKNLSIRPMADRRLVTSENKYLDHSLQVKEISIADQRSFVFAKRKNLIYARRDQRKQRQVEEPGKVRDVRNLAETGRVRQVRNFERNAIFRINERNTDQWSFQYNEERKVKSRKSRMYQKLERDLRRHLFSGAMQLRNDINVLKLREEYRQSTRYHERHITDNRDEGMKTVRNNGLQLRNNGRLSTEQITLQNVGSIYTGKITRNIPSFIRSDERTLLNLNMQVRMNTAERNGRGFRGKLDILRRYSGNRRMKPLKENESFTHVIKNFENKLSGTTVQDRVLRTERNNKSSKIYELEHLSSGGEGTQGSTDRTSRRIRINVSGRVRSSDKRISGDEMRERRASSDRNRNVFVDQSRNIERHNERKMVNGKIQEILISRERSDIKRNVIKQRHSLMILRNGRGFRGKHTALIRMERILSYNYNRNNLFLTVFYHKQDTSVQAKVLKPVENDIRFTVSRRASRKVSFDKNIGKIKNYERIYFENKKNIRNNQRTLLKNTWKINSHLNIFVVQQTANRNIHSIHRNYQERTIPLKSHYSSNRRENDSILSLNHSTSKRYNMRVERFLENARTGTQKTRERGTSEEKKLDNIRQRMLQYRLPEDTILPVYGAFGSPFTSKDITFENHLISSPHIHSTEKRHLNANENWNMRTFFSFTAHIILGLSIVMAASENDPFKCRSFKQRLFDALSLRTEVF